MRPTPSIYDRRLEKLREQLENLGDIPTINGIKKLWDTEDHLIRQAFLELSGWDTTGWVLVEWARLPHSLKEDLAHVRVIEALNRAKQLLKETS